MVHLRHLRGLITYFVDGENEGILAEDLLEAQPLLQACKQLHCLALYSQRTYDDQQPFVHGSLADLSLNTQLEELALQVWALAAEAPVVLPHLHTLHLEVLIPEDFPAALSDTFPRLRKLILGSTLPSATAAYSFNQLPALGHLESLWVTAGADVEAEFMDSLASLRRCRRLRELRLCGLRHLDMEELLQAAKAPQLQRLELQGCDTDDAVTTRLLEVAVRAASCLEDDLDFEVCHVLNPVPCLLPEWFGHWSD